MTAWSLFGLILAGVGVQASALLALAFARHWRHHRQRQGRAGESSPEPDTGARADNQPAWTGFRPFRIARATLEDEAGEVRSLDLVPADGGPAPAHAPGQFLTLRFQVPDPGGGPSETITRCYTISCGPGRVGAADAGYRISVKRMPPPPDVPGAPAGRASTHIHAHLREGDVIEAAAPQGRFTLDPAADAPVVLIGGGIGVTPMLAMLDAICDANPQREVWFLHAARTPADFVRRDALRARARDHPNLHVILVAEAPRTGDAEGRDYDATGRVDLRFLRLTLPLRPFHFYVCGPPAMMESLIPGLLEWGVPKDHVHFEAFGPAALPAELFEADAPEAADPATPAADGQAPSVTFARSRQTIAFDGARSLLDLAERNGIRVNAMCRAGCCGACQTPIRKGEAEHIRAPDVTTRAGHILLCLGRPRTDLVLDA